MIGDYLYQFEIDDEFSGRSNLDMVSMQKREAEYRVGLELMKIFSDGQRHTVKLSWDEQPSFGSYGRRTRYSLRAELGMVREREPFVYKMNDELLRVPQWAKPKPSLLNRVGKFFAEAWREAGKTVQECKAA